MPKKASLPFIAARCTPALKKRIRDAEKSTGHRESDFLRAAVAEFFQNHTTPAAIHDALVSYRASRIAR